MSDHDTGGIVFFAVLLALSLLLVERTSLGKWGADSRIRLQPESVERVRGPVVLGVFAVGLVLNFISGRLAFGWVGLVVIATGGWFFVNPEPGNGARQRVLAAVACLLGVLFVTAAAANYGTY